MTLVENAVFDRRTALTRSRGFTLLELMFTLTVGAILLAVGVPSFVDTVRNNRATTNVNELLTAFSIARSEAIRRGINVSVCRSSDALTCSGNWADGWIVVRDDAATNAAPPVVGAVLQTWPAMPGNATVATLANSAAVDIGWIRFAPRGAARAAGAMPITYKIELAGCSGQQQRTVEVNTIGRTTVTRAACGS